MAETLAATAAPPSSSFATENLKRVPESANLARDLIRTTLACWGLLCIDEPAKVIVTELVSNAVRHAQGDEVRVTLVRLSHDRVRIGVVDRDPNRPMVKAVSLDAESGRGLLLIEAISSTWGVDVLPDGKRVWADLEPAS